MVNETNGDEFSFLMVMDITAAIVTLASERGSTKTICPSEVARKLWPDGWRQHMQEVRNAAFILRDKGAIKITQKGKEIKDEPVIGPIRIGIV